MTSPNTVTAAEPRDGQRVLALIEREGCHGIHREWSVVVWFGMLELSGEADPDPDYHIEVDDQWFFPPGWFLEVLNKGWGYVAVDGTVLEWRELPEIPS